ncbi:MAG: hypothetical protein F6K11_03275 [Leptolyngbya sp. SIO3F4]|nr:hypothetical protein [Leptolyngbya sp. SIO3F4]
MTKKEKTTTRLFAAFGVLTIVSGVYLATQGDYVVGISGSCVGIFLLFLNGKKFNEKKS